MISDDNTTTTVTPGTNDVISIQTKIVSECPSLPKRMRPRQRIREEESWCEQSGNVNVVEAKRNVNREKLLSQRFSSPIDYRPNNLSQRALTSTPRAPTHGTRGGRGKACNKCKPPTIPLDDYSAASAMHSNDGESRSRFSAQGQDKCSQCCAIPQVDQDTSMGGMEYGICGRSSTNHRYPNTFSWHTLATTNIWYLHAKGLRKKTAVREAKTK